MPSSREITNKDYKDFQQTHNFYYPKHHVCVYARPLLTRTISSTLTDEYILYQKTLLLNTRLHGIQGDHPIVTQIPFLHAAMWGGVHLEIKCQCQSILLAKCFNESNALRLVYVYNW